MGLLPPSLSFRYNPPLDFSAINLLGFLQLASNPINHRFSTAPMLDWSDRHARYFYRLMSENAVLYTEMVTTGAIIHGKGDYLAYNEEEHPVVLQLGGSKPEELAKCAKIAEERGYDEINLNVGCPSDRVQNGMFGACLMAQPSLVADCVKAMRDVVDIPVTVKTRIGIDEQDSYEFLCDFIHQVHTAGCDHLIVHARKAWLQGLSPKQNREIPPLNYERVFQVKRDFPELLVSINGGITTLEQSLALLENVDGVMMGRGVYQNPSILLDVDSTIYGLETPQLTRHEIVYKMMEYTQSQIDNGSNFWHVVRHMLGLFTACQGAKAWRRHLSENGTGKGVEVDVLEQALAHIPTV